MTFDPHPPRVVRPDKAPPLLMTKAQKLEAIAAAGVQGAAIVRFTPELSRWDPETFVRTVLVDWLRVAEVWVGANFLFGHDRAGNFSLLRALGARYGFKAEKIDPVRYKDFVVSSTRIRRLVGEGRVDEAGALLGHQYYIDGTVVRRRPARPRRSAFRRRTSAPRTSCCRRTASTRRRRRSTASSTPSVTNIGVAPDRRRVGPHDDRDAHLQLRPRSLRRADPRRLRPAAARRAGVRVAGRAHARRSPPTATGRACSSIAFHCRIAPIVAAHEFFFALDFSGQRAVRRACSPIWRAASWATSAAVGGDRRARRTRCSAALTERRRRRRAPLRRAVSRAAPASSRSSSSAAGRPDWQTTGRCRLPDRPCASTTR